MNFFFISFFIIGAALKENQIIASSGRKFLPLKAVPIFEVILGRYFTRFLPSVHKDNFALATLLKRAIFSYSNFNNKQSIVSV